MTSRREKGEPASAPFFFPFSSVRSSLRSRGLSGTRYVLVRNVPTSATEEQLRALFETAGQVRRWELGNMAAKGVAWVTYWDLRDAERAVETLKGSTSLGNDPASPLEVTFSAPRDNDEERPDADTLFVAKRDGVNAINEAELSDWFSKFGDVKRVGSTPRSHLAKFVQFFDVRSLAKAMAETQLFFDDGVIHMEEAVRPSASSPLVADSPPPRPLPKSFLRAEEQF